MFPDLKQVEKKPVPNAGTELGPGRECSQMLRTGNFSDFFEKSGAWEMSFRNGDLQTVPTKNSQEVDLCESQQNNQKLNQMGKKHYYIDRNLFMNYDEITSILD